MNDRFRPFMSKLGDRISPSVTDMIRMDHSQVLAVFHRYQPGGRAQTRKALVETACLAIEIHAQLEEEIFYPAMRAAGSTMLEDLESEHQEMKSLIATLSGMEPTDTQYDATFMELMRGVIHHVADEETMLLTSAEALLGGQLGELGARMMKRRTELMAPHAAGMAGQKARAMPAGALAVVGGLLAGVWLLRKVRG